MYTETHKNTRGTHVSSIRPFFFTLINDPIVLYLLEKLLLSEFMQRVHIKKLSSPDSVSS